MLGNEKLSQLIAEYLKQVVLMLIFRKLDFDNHHHKIYLSEPRILRWKINHKED